MSEQIKVGDLVYVIRGCCVPTSEDGRIYTVRYFTSALYCASCGETHNGHVAALDVGLGRLVSWLKRIPPLSELEGEKRDEEITA